MGYTYVHYCNFMIYKGSYVNIIKTREGKGDELIENFKNEKDILPTCG